MSLRGVVAVLFLCSICTASVYRNGPHVGESIFEGNCMLDDQEWHFYFGDRNQTRDGHECATWKDVTDEWIGNLDYGQTRREEIRFAYRQFLWSEELMSHNKCRYFQIAEKNYTKEDCERAEVNETSFCHPFANFANFNRSHQLRARLAKQAVKVFSGKLGPWCFVKKTERDQIVMGSSYVPYPCFDTCIPIDDAVAKSTTANAPHMSSTTTSEGDDVEEMKMLGESSIINYNYKLIDNIHHMFTGASFGDPKYYHEVKSIKQSKVMLYVMQRKFAFICVIILVFVILWMTLCYILKRKALQHRRLQEQAIRECFGAERAKLGEILERPKPHL